MLLTVFPRFHYFFPLIGCATRSWVTEEFAGSTRAIERPGWQNQESECAEADFALLFWTMPSPDSTQPSVSAPRRKKQPDGLAESMLVMLICLVAAVGVIRLAVGEVNNLITRIAAVLGLGGN
ncbi:MAG TPA: hypothetical protein VNK82_04645 [Terriglobales bacterium]|nr:hypothetical protein [Terriglobales bacterium]